MLWKRGERVIVPSVETTPTYVDGQMEILVKKGMKE